MMHSIALRFADTVERDGFVTEHFPKREPCSTPGLYRVRGWGMLRVICDRVTLHPYERTMHWATRKEFPRKIKGKEGTPCK